MRVNQVIGVWRRGKVIAGRHIILLRHKNVLYAGQEVFKSPETTEVIGNPRFAIASAACLNLIIMDGFVPGIDQ